MTVVASSAANKTINIKFEIMARVSDVPGSTVPNQRKIVLSLQKKFKSQTSAMEVLIDKDEDKTIAQIRAGIKAERKQYISVRPSTTAVQNNPTTVPANATQLIDVNKFIDQQVGEINCNMVSYLNEKLSEVFFCETFFSTNDRAIYCHNMLFFRYREENWEFWHNVAATQAC